MNIEWSKAPEDATHAGNSPYEKGVITWFKGISDPASRNYFMNSGSMNAWAISSENLSAWDLIERPNKQEAWDGEGLPPAGLDVEVMQGGFPSVAFDWQACKVLAINIGSDERPQVITRDFHGDIAIYYPGIDSVYFRPIKTAEQLAEEEKKKVIDDMQRIYEESILGYSSRLGHASRPAIKALYEAGYRKQ